MGQEFIILDEVMSETLFTFEGEKHQFSAGTFVAVFEAPGNEVSYAIDASDTSDILKAIFKKHRMRGFGFVLYEQCVGLISRLEFPTDR